MSVYFVTGIGTEIGKTFIAAILIEALNADYWKPVQAGDLQNSDTDKVRALISNNSSVFHEETYNLTEPMSPHAAAKIDDVEINIDQISIPETSNNLIIEGCGGLMVPLNDKHLVIDLIQKLNCEVVLVSQNYLGSINHTLLSIDGLKSRSIPVKGIIFNGETNQESEDFILKYSGYNCLGRVFHENDISKETILKYTSQFSESFNL
ncbi:MAG: dethiobiotin synthase [Bacteroidia bacterium]|nr:dethiobiotin synthase [Bacteroidia bacterium]